MAVHPDQLRMAAAANLAGWHETSVQALGVATQTGRWWWTAPTPAPWIYFTAVGLRRPASRSERRRCVRELREHLSDPRGSFEAVCESFDALELTAHGLTPRLRGPWYRAPVARVLAADALDHGAPRRATRSRVRDRRSRSARSTTPRAWPPSSTRPALSFQAPPPLTPHEIHGLATLDDPSLTILVGRVGGEVATCAMAFHGSGVVGLYGVGTLPAHRGHGYATADHPGGAGAAPRAADDAATLGPGGLALPAPRLHPDRQLHPLGLSVPGRGAGLPRRGAGLPRPGGLVPLPGGSPLARGLGRPAHRGVPPSHRAGAGRRDPERLAASGRTEHRPPPTRGPPPAYRRETTACSIDWDDGPHATTPW